MKAREFMLIDVVSALDPDLCIARKLADSASRALSG